MAGTWACLSMAEPVPVLSCWAVYCVVQAGTSLAGCWTTWCDRQQHCLLLLLGQAATDVACPPSRAVLAWQALVHERKTGEVIGTSGDDLLSRREPIRPQVLSLFTSGWYAGGGS